MKVNIRKFHIPQIIYFGLMFFLANMMFSQANYLFTKVDHTESSITFENTIADTEKDNILIYESFYNGGGVGLGDINNDGLLDIYFSGNQVGDKLYLNLGNFKFKDITNEAGIIDKGGWSSGVTFADVNNDGFLDIYVCKTLYDDSPELRRNELYINNKNGTFKESASEWGVDDIWRSKQANFFDFDLDGDLDMFLVNQPPNPGFLSPLSGQNWLKPIFSCRLFENNNNTFKDISKEAGVLQRGYGLNASAADFNNDGWVDLYVSNDYDSPDFLYQNNRDGTFTNIINTSMKHISYFSMGTDSGDINNDGWIDLMTLDMVAEDNFRLKSNMSGMNPKQFWNIVNAGGHHQYMFNTLQLNNGLNSNGDLGFSDIAQFSGVSKTDWSWTPLIADFDNDGHKDIFISNGIKKDLRNNDAKKKSEQYIKEKTEAFLNKNTNAGEVSIWDVINYNNVIDILPSQKLSNYMFKNNGNYQFTQTQEEWGLGELTFSSGAAYGDLDNDGDLDLIISNVDAKAHVYRNNTVKNLKNKSLRIQLKDTNSGKSLFGVKVTIEYDGTKQFVETTNSKGFYSCSESIVHFGIGNKKKIDKITVNWGKDLVTVLKKVKTGNTIIVDKSSAKKLESTNTKQEKNSLFNEIPDNLGIDFKHQENEYNDYLKESLLPHKMSTIGPGMAVADVNGDGLDDFYIGGAINQSGELFIQNSNGIFFKNINTSFNKDKVYEDVGASFIDIDNDGDQDLYVVSGGNEFGAASNFYLDRLYVNDGKGGFSRGLDRLPRIFESGSKVRPEDFDNDGDMDLFVAGRQVPGKYPFPANSYLLVNEAGYFKNVTKSMAPEFNQLGMVTDAIWTDYDSDGDKDLLVVGEWMPITIFENNGNTFSKLAKNTALNNQTGWWFSIEQGDFDNDGDMDYVAGNLGLNYKYKASKEEPFEVYASDFDQSGSMDIILSYYEKGVSYPLRGRECSSGQVPFIKEKFKNYNTFASSSLIDVYSAPALDEALNYKVNTYASIYIENKGNGSFKISELPTMAQFSSINDIIVRDFNHDKKLDLLITGNLFNAEVETPRNDASYGLYLEGNGSGGFKALLPHESGLFVEGDIKVSSVIKLANKDTGIIFGLNNDFVKMIKSKNFN